MNSKMNRLRVVGGASVAALAASALVPTTALAASTSGADLLIPKPAEFIPALVAFVIIWVIMAKVAWPSVLGMMDKRQQKIKDDLDAAAESKVKAAEEAKEYEAKLLSAQKEADAIVAAARKEAETIAAETRKGLAEQLERRTKTAEEKIARAEAQALADVRSAAVESAVAAAERLIGSRLTPDTGAGLVERSIAELKTKLN